MLLRTSPSGSKSRFQSRCGSVLEWLESRNLLSFGAPTNFAAGPGPIAAVAGDVNGDGIPDLAVADVQGVTILLGHGDGTFQKGVNTYSAGANPLSLVLTDLNADGYPDLAVANHDSNDVSILLNDTVWAPSTPGSVHQPPSALPSKQAIEIVISDPQGIFSPPLEFTKQLPDVRQTSRETGSAEPAHGNAAGEVARPASGSAGRQDTPASPCREAAGGDADFSGPARDHTIRGGYENPLLARLAIGSWWRQADLSGTARPRDHQSEIAR